MVHRTKVQKGVKIGTMRVVPIDFPWKLSCDACGTIRWYTAWKQAMNRAYHHTTINNFEVY